MSTFEIYLFLICFGFIVGFCIRLLVETLKLLKRIATLEEQERDINLRIDNLVERMKLYDKELEQIEKDIGR